MWDTLVLVCFVAPSFGSVFAIIVADAVVRVMHYQFVWSHKIDDSVDVETLTSVYSSFVMAEIFLFVILQKRELATFFVLRDIEKKHVSMTTAFNAQSDAVIIVEEQASKSEQLQVKFRNSKSIELFGIDRQDEQA